MADQWNENNPAVGNQISNDVPDIKENLEFIKDILESQGKQTWSDSVATTMFPTTMKDADADTLIQLEESADEDYIRFDTGGTERAYIRDTGLYIKATYNLYVDTIAEFTGANGVTIDSLSIKDAKLNTNNCIVEANITSANVTPVKLKTTVQTDSYTGNVAWQVVTLTGASYCFLPQSKCSNGVANMSLYMGYDTANPGTSYVTKVRYRLEDNTAQTAYLQNRYMTASGPVYWAFGLLNKETERVTRWNTCMDHPSYGNGQDPSTVPHPFADYDKSKFQLLVSNPPVEQLEEFKKLAFKKQIHLSEFIADYCEFNLSRSEKWTKEKVTVGTFPDALDASIGTEVQCIKKSVPKLKEALVLPLKLKE